MSKVFKDNDAISLLVRMADYVENSNGLNISKIDNNDNNVNNNDIINQESYEDINKESIYYTSSVSSRLNSFHDISDYNNNNSNNIPDSPGTAIGSYITSDGDSAATFTPITIKKKRARTSIKLNERNVENEKNEKNNDNNCYNKIDLNTNKSKRKVLKKKTKTSKSSSSSSSSTSSSSFRKIRPVLTKSTRPRISTRTPHSSNIVSNETGEAVTIEKTDTEDGMKYSKQLKNKSKGKTIARKTNNKNGNKIVSKNISTKITKISEKPTHSLNLSKSQSYGTKSRIWTKELDDKLREHVKKCGATSWTSFDRMNGLNSRTSGSWSRWNYVLNVSTGPYTDAEDKLIQIRHTEGATWVQIAKELNRSALSVRGRYSNTLAKNLITGEFTIKEDNMIIENRKKNMSWADIGRLINRSSAAVRGRFMRTLCPGLKTGEFTPEEDEIIMKKRKEGMGWAAIGKEIHRSGASVRAFYTKRVKQLPVQTLTSDGTDS